MLSPNLLNSKNNCTEFSENFLSFQVKRAFDEKPGSNTSGSRKQSIRETTIRIE